MKIDINAIEKLVDEGYISKKKHPTEDLYIYNYTKKTQYDRYWNEFTEMCRGLITDSEGNILARPFKKFYNYGEYEGLLPDGAFDVYEKLDGSLGVLYWVNDTPYLATRGSFISEQSVKGTELLHKELQDWNFDRRYTYLFEIIYPDNRVVVDYGTDEKIVLLAVIDTETGTELDLSTFPAKSVDRYMAGLTEIEVASKLREKNTANKEGFVLKWPNGFRLKMKFDEYVRLHALLTGLTARKIWELMSEQKSLKPLLENVPDEFYKWVKMKSKNFQDNYQEIYKYCKTKASGAKNLTVEIDVQMKVLDFQELQYFNNAYRKEVDKFFKEERPELAHICWDFYYKRPALQIVKNIWELLYPPHELPFKQED